MAFLVDDFEDILEGERLEIQPVTGVVVGGDGLRVAVDHDGLNIGISQSESRVNTGVVEFDSLADAVWPGPQNHYLPSVRWRHLGRQVVARVVIRRIRRELTGAGVDRLVDGAYVHLVPDCPNICFGGASKLSDLRVR